MPKSAKRQDVSRTPARIAHQLKITIGVVIILTLGTYSLVASSVNELGDIREAEIDRYQQRWQSAAIRDYSITILQDGVTTMAEDLPGSGRFKVCNGHIVRIDGTLCALSDDPYACDVDPVTVLFDEAAGCVGLCTVDYNALYGFPRYIGGSLIKEAFIEVAEFHPITCP